MAKYTAQEIRTQITEMLNINDSVVLESFDKIVEAVDTEVLYQSLKRARIYAALNLQGIIEEVTGLTLYSENAYNTISQKIKDSYYNVGFDVTSSPGGRLYFEAIETKITQVEQGA